MSPEALAIAAGAVAGGVLLIFASGWGVVRSITKPLASATDFTRQIAAGNLGTPLPTGGIRDQIGALNFSLEVMRKSLVSIARDVHDGIDGALNCATEIADANARLCAHTLRQAAALKQAAANMEQLAQAMQGNVQSSCGIPNVVGGIEAVACQINLLTLNAAADAARVEQATLAVDRLRTRGARLRHAIEVFRISGSPTVPAQAVPAAVPATLFRRRARPPYPGV